jgi:hypothetical protein
MEANAGGMMSRLNRLAKEREFIQAIQLNGEEDR